MEFRPLVVSIETPNPDPTSPKIKYICNHHPNLEALASAATWGCLFCAQLWRGLSEPCQSRFEEPFQNAQIELYYVEQDDRQSITAIYSHDRSMFFDVVELPHPYDKLVKKQSSASPSTRAEVNHLLVSSWISQCLKNHATCAVTTNPCAPLPTWVIDIGPRKVTQDPVVCAGEGRNGTYAILSRIWGLPQLLLPSLDPLEAEWPMIPLKTTSQVFRQAIDLCKQMDVRYLWNDSLCIKPNSLTDWEKECPKLGTYYKNALFTIAAAWAPDQNYGLFPLSHPPCPAPSLVCIQIIDSVKDWCKTVYVRPAKDPSLPEECTPRRDGYLPMDCVHKFPCTPTTNEAWVLQERLLSTRTVIFHKRQTSWNCLAVDASELRPEGVPAGELQGEVGRGDLLLRKAFLENLSREEESAVAPPLDDGEAQERYNTWNALIERYSDCEALSRRDIFPALSGLASLFQVLSGDQYRAGLWHGDIVRGLLWYAYNIHLKHRVPRVPSWSWAAAIPAHIRFAKVGSFAGEKDRTWWSALESLDVQMGPVGKSEFGNATTGFLHCVGQLKHVNSYIKSVSVEGQALFALLDTNDGCIVGDFWPDYVRIPERDGPLFCLLMAAELPDPMQTFKHRKAVGLALERSVDHEDDRYYMRVGFVIIDTLIWFETALRKEVIIA